MKLKINDIEGRRGRKVNPSGDFSNVRYKKLFDELTKNINDSINLLNFEKLIMFRNKVKFIDRTFYAISKNNSIIYEFCTAIIICY